MILSSRTVRLVAGTIPLFLAAGCGGGADDGAGAGPATIVVSHSILADAVRAVAGDAATVTSLVPAGSDPHDVQISARDAEQMRDAAAVIVNGGGFDEAIDDAIAAAEEDGVDVFAATAAVPGEEPDPHFFTDPVLLAGVTEAIGEHLATAGVGEAAQIRENAADHAGRLRELAATMTAAFEAVPEDRRVLITNHDVFGPFADRFGFEVIATVIPGRSTAAEASAAALAALGDTIESRGVRAIFVDSSSSSGIAERLAADVGEVEVVELFTESLAPQGEPGDTYIEMMEINAKRIVDALT